MDHYDDEEEGTEREAKDVEGREDVGEGVAGGDRSGEGDGEGGGAGGAGGETGESKAGERGGEEFGFGPTVGENRQVEFKRRDIIQI